MISTEFNSFQISSVALL